MTVESPMRVDFGQERAELEAVLSSPHFVRAPKLAHLLAYLCERLFAGETNQVKEYSIGVEVFHRGAGFDQDSDSIVRVEANRLRKRLAEYYAADGAGHCMQITIPLGQYVPEFVPNPNVPAPAASPSPDPMVIPAVPAIPRRKIRKRTMVLIVVAGLLAVGSVAAWWMIRQARLSSPAAVPVAPADLARDFQVGPPAGDEVRILCGATRALVDHAGKLWSADTGFTGGAAVRSEVQHISRTQDPAFYRTSRQGAFRYDIALKPGVYELRLHFAEVAYGPESTGTGGEGNRLMTVRANGKVLLTRFDVAADAGASATADVKVFPDIAPDRDGFLHLDFTPERGTPAMLSAIEILPGIRGQIRPVRILARQTPYYSNDSHWWSPDAYFEGGQSTIYTHPVSGTDDPELFDSERWGNFSYAIPAAPGKYTVTLYFAARHGEWPPGSGTTVTPHVFNVFCNGKVLLQNFDVSREARQRDAGQTDVVVRRAAGLVPNAQGKLLLSFVPVEGYATVTGIEVIPQ
jgi:hypothetical protein